MIHLRLIVTSKLMVIYNRSEARELIGMKSSILETDESRGVAGKTDEEKLKRRHGRFYMLRREEHPESAQLAIRRNVGRV